MYFETILAQLASSDALRELFRQASCDSDSDLADIFALDILVVREVLWCVDVWHLWLLTAVAEVVVAVVGGAGVGDADCVGFVEYDDCSNGSAAD